MEPLELLLIGSSLAITGFVGFSVVMQYRYATQLVDMLRIYPILIGVSFALLFSPAFLGVGVSTNYLLVSPFIEVVILILWYYSLDWYSDYTSSSFREFLEVIKSDDFEIISFDDYENGHISMDKVNVILRHDVDISLSRTKKMAETQKELGIHSTYFFRLHAEKYTFEEAVPIIKKLADDGFGIGLHYETLSLAEGDRKKAIDLLERDIGVLREIAPVRVVAAHGQKGYKNREIWIDVDKSSLSISSAYDMENDLYLSDAGGKRLRGKNGKYLFDRIYEAKPGQIVQVLIHPDWWF